MTRGQCSAMRQPDRPLASSLLCIRRGVAPQLLALLLTCVGSVSMAEQPFDFVLRRVLSNEKEAIRNGEAVRQAFRTGHRPNNGALVHLVGKRVAFLGRNAPEGMNLYTFTVLEDGRMMDDLLLVITIVPHEDLRPATLTSWQACVLGVLTAVDPERRVVFLKARPVDWRVLSGG